MIKSINIENEIWVPIFDEKFKDKYEVSNMGRISRIRYIDKERQARTPMKFTNVHGYSRLTLRYNKKKIGFSINRVVYFSFNPYTDQSLVINHLNGIKNDNRLENLEAVTQKANVQHCYNIKGNRCQKIHPDDYNNILKLYQTGTSNEDIAKNYNVKKDAISKILNKKLNIIQEKRFSSNQHKEILKLHDYGLSGAEIGRLFNTDRTTIYYSIKNKLSKGKSETILTEYIDENNIIWKPIIVNNIKCPYYISSTGKIKNKKNKLLKLRISEHGYYVHSLRKYYKISAYVHRIVASMFIPNPDSKPVVNHKDGNKLNNHVSNLEWTTHSENTKHWVSTKLLTDAQLRKR